MQPKMRGWSPIELLRRQEGVLLTQEGCREALLDLGHQCSVQPAQSFCHREEQKNAFQSGITLQEVGQLDQEEQELPLQSCEDEMSTSAREEMPPAMKK